jgi:hypothetical protein
MKKRTQKARLMHSKELIMQIDIERFRQEAR